MCEDAVHAMLAKEPLPPEIVAFRAEAFEKLRSLEFGERYAGKWVILVPGRTICADTLDEALAQVDRLGVPRAYMQGSCYIKPEMLVIL
jgi:hypothetical protein